MAEQVLKALKYSDADIADSKLLMRDTGAAVEQFQKLAEKMPNVELGLDIDITEYIPDELLEKGRDYADEKLADYIGCDDD